MEKIIKFGIVGCGRISGKHIEAIANHHQVARLVCVCDLIKERAYLKAREYLMRLEDSGLDQKTAEPSVYIQLDEMLEKEDIDVLTICTPSGLHPVHGIMAAGKKINVLTEKPMATNLKAADELIKACDEAGTNLFVVKQNRLNSTVKLLKRAVDKGRFGKIHMILVNVLWQRPQSYYDEAAWRGTWEFDGGAFCNQASHYVDLMEWLGGPVESVIAMTGTLARKIQAEDTGSAVIRFKNGAIGNINVTVLTYPCNLEGSITIIGENGTARIAGVAVNRIDKWEFREEDEDDNMTASLSYEPPDVYGFGHTGYYGNVLEVLKGNAKPNTDGSEGRKSLELIMGIYESSRKGMPVYLPINVFKR